MTPMTGTTKGLAVAYFTDLRRLRVSRGATGEQSSDGPMANLLNAVGATLKPNKFCVGELVDLGAGHPDFGFHAANRCRSGGLGKGRLPSAASLKSSPPAMTL